LNTRKLCPYKTLGGPPFSNGDREVDIVIDESLVLVVIGKYDEIRYGSYSRFTRALVALNMKSGTEGKVAIVLLFGQARTSFPLLLTTTAPPRDVALPPRTEPSQSIEI
jgi:hypothetical protein